MELIDKDALVAEITKIYDRNRSNGYIDVCDEIDDILSFIDTLEVKEVDLDKEIDLVEDKYHGFESLSRADFKDFAKHFFELGMLVSNKAQKGE